MQVKDIQEHLTMDGHVDFTSMKEELMQFTGTKINVQTAGAIRTLLSNLNSTVFVALHKDRDAAQTLIDDARAAVVDCNDDRATAFSDVDGKTVWDAEGLVNSTRDNHTECKDHGSDGQEHLHGVMTTVCTRHDNRIKRYHNCGTNDETKDSDAVYAWMRCLENFTTHHCDLYEIGREQCENATKDHSDAEKDCHEKQNTFENAVCALNSDINNACAHYEGCYDSANASWWTTKATVEDMEVLFKAQMQALEQILCFGNAILANNTDYDQCEFDTCAECPNMNITYTRPPAEVQCNEALAETPCDNNFMATEYGKWNNDTADLLAACQACPSSGDGDSDNSGPAVPDTVAVAGSGNNWCDQNVGNGWEGVGPIADATACKNDCSAKGRAIWGLITLESGNYCHCFDSCSGFNNPGGTRTLGNV